MIKDRPVAEGSTSTLRVSIADMIFLNVRTKGRGNRDLPVTLYQCLPAEAMALMATIPCGAFAVSVPGGCSPGRGWPILKSAPRDTGGITVVYCREPNGRYEAAAAQHRHKSFPIGEFIPFARRWVEENMGMLKAIPGRYGYFAPEREEWGVILRDSGYAAWDPSWMYDEAGPELSMKRHAPGSSGILARIPAFSGDRWQREELLPVFARAEVLVDSSSGLQSHWISFDEYQRMRAQRERLPDSFLPDFQEWLRRLTEDSGFQCWLFRPGMLFGDREEWWSEGCRRRTEHEGVDFAAGVLPGGGVRNIPEGVPVRSPAEGEVVAVLDDFIAKTVVVRHPAISRASGCTLHTLLSHIQPRVGRQDPVARGQVLGTVGKSTKASAPCHLHLTGAWIPDTLSADEIRMELIHPAFEPVSLINFKNQLQGNPLCSPGNLEG